VNRRTRSLLVAGGRIGFGALLVADPGRLVSAWIGREGRNAGPQALGRAVGARDLVLGAGAIAAADDTLVPWLIAALVADSTDLLATLAAGRGIPLRSRILVGAAALSGVLGDLSALAAPSGEQ
jgi:hypothetical protein